MSLSNSCHLCSCLRKFCLFSFFCTVSRATQFLQQLVPVEESAKPYTSTTEAEKSTSALSKLDQALTQTDLIELLAFLLLLPDI
jgi:hypothetical protein